ncbi:MAG: cobaltochelatase subunit CobN, partial [Shewanella sp.]
RSSHVFQVLDGDDPFASFGGVSMAVRAVDGKSPEVMISHLANPNQAQQETLDRFMGRELRSRYLNPEWIEAMQAEGYAGAKFINSVVQNLWGWQVTVPEAVDAGKWDDLYQTYVEDRYQLGMEAFFRDAENIGAYQMLMSRMLEAIRKGYWQPDESTVQDLSERVSKLIQEQALNCDSQQCEDPIVQKLIQAKLVAAPQLAPIPTAASEPNVNPEPNANPEPDAATEEHHGVTTTVQGYAIEEVAIAPSAEGTNLAWQQWASYLLLCLIFTVGFLGRCHPQKTNP